VSRSLAKGLRTPVRATSPSERDGLRFGAGVATLTPSRSGVPLGECHCVSEIRFSLYLGSIQKDELKKSSPRSSQISVISVFSVVISEKSPKD
jgi:hypothetical protein